MMKRFLPQGSGVSNKGLWDDTGRNERSTESRASVQKGAERTPASFLCHGTGRQHPHTRPQPPSCTMTGWLRVFPNMDVVHEMFLKSKWRNRTLDDIESRSRRDFTFLFEFFWLKRESLIVIVQSSPLTYREYVPRPPVDA